MLGVLEPMQLAAIHDVDSADANQGRAVRVDHCTPRVSELQAKLAARDGKPGYRRNVQAIRGEISRLQQEASHGR